MIAQTGLKLVASACSTPTKVAVSTQVNRSTTREMVTAFILTRTAISTRVNGCRIDVTVEARCSIVTAISSWVSGWRTEGRVADCMSFRTCQSTRDNGKAISSMVSASLLILMVPIMKGNSSEAKKMVADATTTVRTRRSIIASTKLGSCSRVSR